MNIQGRVFGVYEEQEGSQLAEPTAAVLAPSFDDLTATFDDPVVTFDDVGVGGGGFAGSLFLHDASPFDDDPGQAVIADDTNSDLISYEGIADYDTGEMYGVTGLTHDYNEDHTSVKVYPTATVRWALVQPDGETETIAVRVPHSLYSSLPTGFRDVEAGETESIVVDYDGEYFIKDVLGAIPLIDGSTIDPGTLPPPPPGDDSDGIPPASSPGVSVQGGVGYLVAKWTGVSNADIVFYEVHVSTSSGFTPDAGTLYAKTTGTLMFIYTLPDGTNFSLGTTYYVRLVATDADGAAAPGTQGSASIVKLPSDQIQTDGLPPAASPTPVVQGGIGILSVRWLPIANHDPVEYEVHVSTSSGFTPSGTTPGSGTCYAVTAAGSAVVRTLPDGTALNYVSTYYVKLIARDDDGSAAAGAQGSAQLVQVNGGIDILANSITAVEILAHSILADNIAAGTITADEIATGTIIAANIAAQTITAGELAADSVTADQIAADAVTAASILAGSVTAGKLESTLLLSTMITTALRNEDGVGPARVEMDALGIRCYAQNEALLLDVPTDGSPIILDAQVQAASLSVAGDTTFDGDVSLSPGATMTVEKSVQNPKQKPALGVSWDTVAFPHDDVYDDTRGEFTRSGLNYSDTGGAGGATKVFWTTSLGANGHVYILELLASDRTVNRALDLSVDLSDDAGFGTIDICQLGAYLYVLYFSLTTFTFQVARYFASDLSQDTIYTSVSFPIVPASPKITSDGTNIYIVDKQFTSTSGKWNKYSSTMVKLGSTVTMDTTVDDTFIGAIAAGTFDFGAFRIAIAWGTATGSREVWTYNSTGNVQTTEAFPVPNIYLGPLGITYGDALGDGAVFWTYSGSNVPDVKLFKHTTWTWTGGSSIVWFGYSWYDSVGFDESEVGPREQITVGKRQRVHVTTAPIPGGGPDSVRIYAKRQGSDPGTTGVLLQATLTPGDVNTYIRDLDGGGTAGPASNSFADSVAGIIKSAGTGWSLGGSGIVITGNTRLTSCDSTQTGTINDWSPTGLSFSGVIRWEGASNASVNTLLGMVTDRLFIIENATAFGDGIDLTLKHQNAGSGDPTGQFRCPGASDLTLAGGDCALIHYDDVNNRWRVVSHT